jgi:hypothetical protein
LAGVSSVGFQIIESAIGWNDSCYPSINLQVDDVSGRATRGKMVPQEMVNASAGYVGNKVANSLESKWKY